MASAQDDAPDGAWRRIIERLYRWRNRLIATPSFQSWAIAFPPTRFFARHEAARLYDIVAGFAYSQTLLACVELDVLEALRRGPQSAETLARSGPLSPERMRILCQAAAALDLLQRTRDGRYRLGPLGAACLGAPGLLEMVRHHRLFYADVADPVGMLAGATETQLSRFWRYVDGACALPDDAAAAYSRLMASSQALVAEETLRAISLRGARALLDVGGGDGAFAAAVAAAYPELKITVFDLPAVAARASLRFAASDLLARVHAVGGSFFDDPLPSGVDTVSLVRVLYDHSDETVAMLLGKAFDALAAGGTVIISEPMAGGARPNRAGDVYFGLYTAAMTSGEPRSAERYGALLARAGFVRIKRARTVRPFITGVVTASKPA